MLDATQRLSCDSAVFAEWDFVACRKRLLNTMPALFDMAYETVAINNVTGSILMSTTFPKTKLQSWTDRLMRRVRRHDNKVRATILSYQNVSQQDTIFTHGMNLRHSPAEFERQIEFLAENYDVVRLDDLIEALEKGEDTDRVLAIVFMGGYTDVLRQAMPILYRRRLPMTIFPVTSTIGNTDLMWEHKLTWLINGGHEVAVVEALARAGWHEFVGGESLEEQLQKRYRSNLPTVLEQVLRDVGTSSCALANEFRPYIEIEDMADVDLDLVSFGNFTDTHPVLSALTPDQQREEIATARSTLIALTRQAPQAFAYPYGLKTHYNEDSRQIAWQTGHRACLNKRRRGTDGRVNPVELSCVSAPHGGLIDLEAAIAGE